MNPTQKPRYAKLPTPALKPYLLASDAKKGGIKIGKIPPTRKGRERETF
jgi:hypothetical protein